MYFTAGAYSDAGLKKSVNQDSICILQGEYPMHGNFFNENRRGRVVMGMVCDGMGGEKQGEIASKAGIEMFRKWFTKKLPEHLKKYEKPGNHSDDVLQNVSKDFEAMINDLNHDMCRYGTDNGIRLGTTLSVIIIFDDGRYILAHTGDSRIYRIERYVKKISQITKDQSLVADEVRKGIITKDEALKDSRRNILTECIGISDSVSPIIETGRINSGVSILICSDGFYHEIRESEMGERLSEMYGDKEEIKRALTDMIRVCKSRGEKDNISAVLITCRGKDRRDLWLRRK